MVFSSPIFLFLFLPPALLLYYVLPARLRTLRNLWLTLISLLFYAWGEPIFVLVMLLSITVNYALALPLGTCGEKPRRILVTAACVFNIGLLIGFKYLNLLFDTVGLGGLLPDIALPIGISFFTFQALSYVLDVSRGDAPVQKNPLDLALYVALFPQLIAGPIVRYADVARQIRHRVETHDLFVSGLRRFLIGLGKKVLIANALGRVTDTILAAGIPSLGASAAWLALICYVFQLYFDFSGYSCMAIGLGRMFGFEFLENFNYPYIANSVQNFWRRWHISLSSWFRDYVYIPLGGSRKGQVRTLLNTLIVFALTGIWHGANWNFLVFGLIGGTFIVLERTRIIPINKLKVPVLPQVYVLLVWMLSCVFFRTESFVQAAQLIRALFGGYEAAHSIAPYLTPRLFVTLLCAAVGCLPYPAQWARGITARASKRALPVYTALSWALLLLMFVLCLSELSAGTYNPFIYFRF